MSAVDKLLALTGNGPAPPDPDTELLFAAQRAARELEQLVGLADDGDDDEGDGDHSGHSTYKAMIKRDVDPKKAASMCARADKRVKASQLARSLAVMLAGTPGRDIVLTLSAARPAELPPATERDVAAALLAELSVLDQEARDKEKAKGHTIGDTDDYPIPDKAHLSSAVARYKQGKLAGHSKSEVAAHIRKHARRLGEEVDLSSGSGLEEAAEALALAAKKAVGDGGIVMNHGPFNGTHEHGHFQSAVHSHPHQHFGDSSHDGGPQHRPGSQPGGRGGYRY